MPNPNDPSYWLAAVSPDGMPKKKGRYVPIVVVFSAFTRRTITGKPSNSLWVAWIRARLLALWTDINIPGEGIGIGWAVRDRLITSTEEADA